MSTTSTPPEEGKPEDVAISSDEVRPSDIVKPSRRRKPRNTVKTVKEGKPPEVATSSVEESSGEVVTPSEEGKSPEVMTPPEEEALVEAVILTEEGTSGEVVILAEEEPSGEVAILAEEVISEEVVTPPEEGTSPEVATTPEEKNLDEVITPPEEGTPPEVATTPEEGTSPNTEIASQVKPRDAAYWAQQASTLRVSHVPTGALNLNVEGRQAVGPLQGFGQMWQKTYRVPLKGASVQPTEVIKTWKEHFTEFWPKGNRFYAPLTGIAPGEVALIKLSLAGGLPLSTGVMVLYADEESFTLMTPQGHSFAGWITFSSYEGDDYTIAQIQVLVRTNDPAYEIAFRLGASKFEDTFWHQTAKALAAYFGVVDSKVEATIVCIDPKVQWSRFWNIWHNGVARTVLYRILTPVRWVFKRRSR